MKMRRKKNFAENNLYEQVDASCLVFQLQLTTAMKYSSLEINNLLTERGTHYPLH